MVTKSDLEVFQHRAYSASTPSNDSAFRFGTARPVVSVAFGARSKNPGGSVYRTRSSWSYDHSTGPVTHRISKQLPHAPSNSRESKSATAATASSGNGKSALDSRPSCLFTKPHPLPCRSPNACGANARFQDAGASKYVARPRSQSPGRYSESSIERIVAAA